MVPISKNAHKAGGIREMISISLPMVVALACDTLMIFTDRVFLSRLGSEIMNAALGGGLTCFMMATLFTGLVGYSTALVAQYLGAGKKEFCSKVLTQSIFIIVAGYPVIILARPLAYMMFELMEIAPQQLAPQKIYFDIMIFGTVIGLLRTAFSSFFSGIGQTRVVMVAACVSMVTNIVLNYILIYGKLGFPAMGITGAAYGTIIGGCVGLCILVTTYLKKKNRCEFAIGRSMRFAGDVFYKLVRYGYPAGLEMFLNVFAFNFLIMIFQSHSPITATAASIMFNWDMVSFVPLIGIEIGVTSLVGRAMGSGKPELADLSVISGLKLGLIYSAIILILFVGLPHFLVGLFKPVTGDLDLFTEAFPLAVFMIRTASFYVMANAVIIVFIGALRGAGDTIWSMGLTVGLHLIMATSGFLMLRVLGSSPEDAWIVLTIVFILASFAVYARYRSEKWKNIKMIGHEPSLQRPDYFHEPAEM
jgi:MATE family multidrug resistance protein